MSRSILVATGTKREAAVLKQSGLTIIPGGGDAARLRGQLSAAAPGAIGILSFGFAGALADSLKIADWVVGSRLTGTVEAECDPHWSAALAAAIPGARTGTIYADGRLISDMAEKRAIGARHSAIAVDMESHIAARVAAEHGRPFAIIRCISDEARHPLPPAIAVAMRPDGGVDGLAMLRSLVTEPGQVPQLIRTMRGFMQAMAALKQGGRLLCEQAAFQP